MSPTTETSKGSSVATIASCSDVSMSASPAICQRMTPLLFRVGHPARVSSSSAPAVESSRTKAPRSSNPGKHEKKSAPPLIGQKAFFRERGGGIIFSPRGRNFVPPPLLDMPPHPEKGIDSGGGEGV